MRRSPTWIFALITLAAMAAGGWYALRPRETLTILSLLQRKYDHVRQSADIDDGVLLALEEVGHLAGRYHLVVAPRDIRPEFDVYRGPDEAVREAKENPGIVAVIGASQYHTDSILRSLNQMGVLVVGPADPEAELTKPGFGSSNYTPESYRPTGERNFYRVIPADDVVERGCAEWAKRVGARTALILSNSKYELRADAFERTARRLGIACTTLDSPYVGLLDAILGAEADVIYFRGSGMYPWLQALSEARCVGWGGRFLVRGDDLESYREPGNEVPDGVITVSRAGPPADFAARFARRFNRPAHRDAWYGYVAARTVIDSIDLANTRDRNEIRRAAARLRSFDAEGDTLSNGLEVSILRNERLVPLGSFMPAPPPPPAPKPRISVSFEGTLEEQRGVLTWEMRGTYYIDRSKIDMDDCLTEHDLDWLRQDGHAIIEGPAPADAVRAPKSLEERKALVDRVLTERKAIELLFQQPGDDFEEFCKYLDAKGFIVVLPRDAK